MFLEEYETDRYLIARLDHDSDIIESITQLAKDNDVEAGVFTAIGALKRATLEFYDQDEHEYGKTVIDEPRELASCMGNISILEGDPFPHTHAVLASEDGDAIAGHLSSGVVFATEVHLQVLDGSELVRTHEDPTDLSMWGSQ